MQSTPPQDALEITAALKAAGFAAADVVDAVAAALTQRNALDIAGSLLAVGAFPETQRDTLAILLARVARFDASSVAAALDAYFPEPPPPPLPPPSPPPAPPPPAPPPPAAPPPPPIFIVLETENMKTLTDFIVLFPKGNETVVAMSQQNRGPFPCPSGDICSPFGGFPLPLDGTKRAYRLKAVYYDENAGGDSHIQIKFKLFSSAEVTFDLPRICSAMAASNFHFSNWYMPETIDAAHGRVSAEFVGSAPYNNNAAVYSLILEAHDVPVYNGLRVRNDDDGALYLMLDGSLRHIPSPDVYWQIFRDEGYRHIRGTGPYVIGKPLPASVALARVTDEHSIFLLVDGVKRLLGSMEVFGRSGFDWSKIQNRTADEMRNIPDGPEIH